MLCQPLLNIVEQDVILLLHRPGQTLRTFGAVSGRRYAMLGHYEIVSRSYVDEALIFSPDEEFRHPFAVYSGKD